MYFSWWNILSASIKARIPSPAPCKIQYGVICLQSLSTLRLKVQSHPQFKNKFVANLSYMRLLSHAEPLTRTVLISLEPISGGCIYWSVTGLQVVCSWQTGQKLTHALVLYPSSKGQKKKSFLLPVNESYNKWLQFLPTAPSGRETGPVVLRCLQKLLFSSSLPQAKET